MNPPLPLPVEDLARLVVAFVGEETRKAGFRRGVIGLSGGLDSAVSLLLTARALGPENTLAVMMPYRTSSPESLRDAREVAAVAGCRQEVIDISPMVDAFREAAACDDALRLGNKMARERMSLLYDRAARDLGLVIGTSNKTELLLGYSTRWGDSGYDINPLGDLYKNQVRALGEHLGVPPAILTKPPSADLWPGQTDEAELGLTYAAADLVLWYLVDQRGSPDRAPAELGLPPETVRAVVSKVAATQYKRNLPPICKIQARTVGIDFRFPRDWGL